MPSVYYSANFRRSTAQSFRSAMQQFTFSEQEFMCFHSDESELRTSTVQRGFPITSVGSHTLSVFEDVLHEETGGHMK